MMKLWVLICVLTAATPAVRAQVVSTGVGLIRNQAVTSREVQIQNLLEIALYQSQPKDKLKPLGLDSKAFSKAVADTLLEAVLAMEAQNFNLAEVTPEDCKGAEAKALRVLKDAAVWKNLQVSQREIDAGVKRKIQAKKFTQLRAQSSLLPVTDGEAQKYFNENRGKFGNLPFENLKENIKSYLGRTHVDQRLKDWYDVLLNKYQVKNLIAEM
ncbi:MAG: hypothetical protein KGQ59_10710 [Bdellovibrionales bacterium]|nr:hypothetical protein [Bdellovibrionales bacterium]